MKIENYIGKIVEVAYVEGYVEDIETIDGYEEVLVIMTTLDNPELVAVPCLLEELEIKTIH